MAIRHRATEIHREKAWFTPSFGVDGKFAPRYARGSVVFEGAVMARENMPSLIGDLKARMTTIRDSL
jgi:hypothetical protein